MRRKRERKELTISELKELLLIEFRDIDLVNYLIGDELDMVWGKKFTPQYHIDEVMEKMIPEFKKKAEKMKKEIEKNKELWDAILKNTNIELSSSNYDDYEPDIFYYVNNKKYKVSYLTSTSNPYILFETALKNRIE